MVEGTLERTNSESVRVVEERWARNLPVADVVDVSHPGTERIAAGSVLGVLGLIGQVTLGVIAFEQPEPYVDPSTGFADDDEGCELCVLGLPGSITPLAFGTGLILHGVALRMESKNQWLHHGNDVGAAHLRVGGGALATGLLLSALTPLIAIDEPAIAATAFTLIGLAPGFVLSGIALLIRGARLRRSQRPAALLTARGFAFDLSL